MFQKKIVYCPVGNHVELGYITKGMSGMFVCRECQFVFPVDKDGKFGVPIRIQDAKAAAATLARRYCGPDGCVCH